MAKTEDVARAWATQSKPKLKAASASFAGLELFSYGTRIGLIVPNSKGLLCIALISERSFSNSTAVVQGQARQAVNDAGLRRFNVAYCGADAATHDSNMRDYDRRVGQHLSMIERAVKPDIHRDAAGRVLAEQKAYAKVFALTAKPAYTIRKIAATRSAKERGIKG